MKFSVLLIILIASTLVQAGEANVYCRTEKGSVVSALSEDGHYDCAADLWWGGACFTGKRSAAIELINGDSFNWDEEWLEGAHYKGRDSIAYVTVDGPNEIREHRSMERCSEEFFKAQ